MTLHVPRLFAVDDRAAWMRAWAAPDDDTGTH